MAISTTRGCRATLLRRRVEWEGRAALITEWEKSHRQITTLSGIWDELRLDREKCLSRPSELDKDFMRNHYARLFDLADSMFCREAIQAMGNLEMVNRGRRLPKVDHVPKEAEKETSSIGALAHAEAVAAGEAAQVGDENDPWLAHSLDLDFDDVLPGGKGLEHPDTPALHESDAWKPHSFDGMDGVIARQLNLEPQFARTKAVDDAMLHAADNIDRWLPAPPPPTRGSCRDNYTILYTT